jgi:hypothetical protein
VHAELLETAKKLICSTSLSPASQTDLRRAVSTAYYACFHFASNCCVVDLLGLGSKNLSRAKSQIYRSLDHKDISAACVKTKDKDYGFPDGIRSFSIFFENMRKFRIRADYDIDESSNFNASHVQHLIGECEEAIKQYSEANVDDRKAFAILMAIKTRTR